MSTDEKNLARKRREGQAFYALSDAATVGLTWWELADKYGWHHGTASAALSTMHQRGSVVRLAEKRRRAPGERGSSVYVLPLHTEGRASLPRKTPKVSAAEQIAKRIVPDDDRRSLDAFRSAFIAAMLTGQEFTTVDTDDAANVLDLIDTLL